MARSNMLIDHPHEMEQRRKELAHFVRTEEALMEATAELMEMTEAQAWGYIKLLQKGEHHRSAALLMRRVPDCKVTACISALC